MDKEAMEAELQEILGFMEQEQASIDASFEKLLIATSNVFRLSNEQKTTLSTLQGSPDELHGYVINLLSQIKERYSSSTKALMKRVQELMVLLDE